VIPSPRSHSGWYQEWGQANPNADGAIWLGNLTFTAVSGSGHATYKASVFDVLAEYGLISTFQSYTSDPSGPYLDKYTGNAFLEIEVTPSPAPVPLPGAAGMGLVSLVVPLLVWARQAKKMRQVV
jgi:hypothetical protein